MNHVAIEPGSFRDPMGRVFVGGDHIYRATSAKGRTAFEFVAATGLLAKLEDAGKIVTSRIVPNHVLGGLARTDGIVLEHEKIPYISYPYEWSFSFLKAAALLHLDIHLQALEVGVTLSDASAYNVQFRGSHPVFIDILSFRPLKTGETWDGHRQFCEQFLNPLLLKSKLDIDPNAWYRGTQEGISTPEINRLLPWYKKLSWKMLTHVVAQSALQNANVGTAADARARVEFPLASYRRMLTGLRNWIETIEPAKKSRTEWQDYATGHSYADAEQQAKAAFVARFAAAVTPDILWDIGCNTGDYSAVALANGAAYSVGFDVDQGALTQAYGRAIANDMPFQPLYFDGANPSPSQGWNEAERKSMSARRNADGLIALAFIHHMAIGRNIPLEHVIRWLVGLAPEGVIEFVPKADPMVRQLLTLREDIFEDYSLSAFTEYLREMAEIVATDVITKSGRQLFWYKRKSG
ncbi:class I SAM-dependent methyltransferase [Sneathiella sp.]|uniref:class I SAM-dependent methyltransferase n=1 Tax=Sneathiella sp. TaxID=1964365 RepID=UPI0035696D9B